MLLIEKVGMVFQNYALYPHLSVLENIQFPLKMEKVPKKERLERAMELAKLVKIEEHVNKNQKSYLVDSNSVWPLLKH